MRAPKTSLRDLAIVLTFSALVAIPLIALAFGAARSDDAFIIGAERRPVATMPPQAELTTKTAEYTHSLERVLADRFPMRTHLIGGYDWAKFALLADSSSASVMRGRGGWLFLGEPQIRAYITGAFHPSDADLDYIVAVFRAHADFCAAHGAHFVAIFAPDKSTVYPEFLPAGTALVHPTMLERLVPRLRAGGVDALDPTAAVIAAKTQGDVFSRGDTHWNARGAYAGYRVLADDVRRWGMRPIPAGAVQIHLSEQRGDLLNLSGVGAIFSDRQADAVFPERAQVVATPQYALGGPPVLDPNASLVPDPSLPTAVFFGDSFSIRLRPFIAEGFRRVVFVQSGEQFNEHIIAAEHPNVVIEELVERNLIAGLAQ